MSNFPLLMGDKKNLGESDKTDKFSSNLNTMNLNCFFNYGELTEETWGIKTLFEKLTPQIGEGGWFRKRLPHIVYASEISSKACLLFNVFSDFPTSG